MYISMLPKVLQIYNSSHSNALPKFPAQHRFRCYPHDSWLFLSLGVVRALAAGARAVPGEV